MFKKIERSTFNVTVQQKPSDSEVAITRCDRRVVSFTISKVGDIHLEPTSRVVTFFVTTRPKREQNRLRHEL